MSSVARRSTLSTLDLPRIYTIVVSLAFFLSGVVGVVMGDGIETFDLFSFPMNVPHGAAHMVLGIVGFVALGSSRELAYPKFMATVLTFLFLAGTLPQPAFGFLPLGGSDMFLHGVPAALGGYVLAKAGPQKRDPTDAMMASLVAIEHTRLLIERTSPTARDATVAAASDAVAAADARLAAVRDGARPAASEDPAATPGSGNRNS